MCCTKFDAFGSHGWFQKTRNIEHKLRFAWTTLWCLFHFQALTFCLTSFVFYIRKKIIWGSNNIEESKWQFILGWTAFLFGKCPCKCKCCLYVGLFVGQNYDLVLWDWRCAASGHRETNAVYIPRAADVFLPSLCPWAEKATSHFTLSFITLGVGSLIELLFV